ncbi:MAG: metallophosphoesterase [Pseudomonas sp.]|nr:metallophosphoesterase [Pseudomonas sp.]
MSRARTHIPSFVSDNKFYCEYGQNLAGRDFVVGDIHGEYDKLMILFDSVQFKLGIDRIFLAGDLVDRGPKPMSVLGLLRKDGVIAVRGNHDQWCIEAGLVGEPAGHRKYGGEWFYQLSTTEQNAVGMFLNMLPVAVSFIGPCGNRYGLVHGECTFRQWDWFKEALSGDFGTSFRDHHVTEAIWRRTRYEKKNTLPVSGVEKVFVGHTVVDDVIELGNTVYLDTGGCFKDGRLTMLELKAGGDYRQHQV